MATILKGSLELTVVGIFPYVTDERRHFDRQCCQMVVT